MPLSASVRVAHGRNIFELDEFRGTNLLSGREVVPIKEFKRCSLVKCRGRICQVGRLWSSYAGMFRRVMAGIRVYPQLISCLGCRSGLQKP